MGATSVTGQGEGAVRRPSAHQVAVVTLAPTIIFSGIVEATASMMSPPSSPPSSSNTVEFPYVLVGGADEHVILLTTLNAGSAYVSSMDEDEDGNLSGFSFVSEADGSVMYMVTKVGSKPAV